MGEGCEWGEVACVCVCVSGRRVRVGRGSVCVGVCKWGEGCVGVCECECECVGVFSPP